MKKPYNNNTYPSIYWYYTQTFESVLLNILLFVAFTDATLVSTGISSLPGCNNVIRPSGQ